MAFTFYNEKYMDKHFVNGYHNGNANAALKISDDFHDTESQIDVFNNVR
jgi:hypothetical protein